MKQLHAGSSSQPNWMPAQSVPRHPWHSPSRQAWPSGTDHRRVDTSRRWVACVVVAGVIIVAANRGIDAPGRWIAAVFGAGVAVVTVARIAYAGASPIAPVLLGAGVAVIARPSRDRLEDAIARIRIARVVRTSIVIVAFDRGVDALSFDSRVDGAEIAVVAANAAAPAVFQVVVEVGVDRVAMGLMGRNGTLRDLDFNERILLRARAVTDTDPRRPAPHRTGVARLRRGCRPGATRELPEHSAPRRALRQCPGDTVEPVVVHTGVPFHGPARPHGRRARLARTRRQGGTPPRTRLGRERLQVPESCATTRVSTLHPSYHKVN